jgi:cephalosporin hydroxylase
MSGELQAAIEHRIMRGTRWMGVRALKNPMDAWVYEEIIYRRRPDWIVEVGNNHGGALLYLANLCDLTGHGRVVGVDVRHGRVPQRVREHPRITLVRGDALRVFPRVASLVSGEVMVIEDSAHTYQHTLEVLRTYGRLVNRGGYMVCEDGVMAEVADALETFTAETSRFRADRGLEWPVTWNPGGYLRAVR